VWDRWKEAYLPQPQNQLDSCSRFDMMPTCDRQTDRHTTTAKTARQKPTDRQTDTRQQQKQRGKNRYISPNCPEARRIGRDVGCDEFFGDRLTGVDFVGGG